jgi:hypothetical protein
MRLRFSIGGLMALIAYFAALFAGTVVWGDPMTMVGLGLMSVELGVLCSAVLGVAYSRGSRRGFWAGFALFGWALAIVGFWESQSLGPLALYGVLPFAYLGGLAGQGFAERSEADRDRDRVET